MRELIATKRTGEPGVTKSVYRSDLIYCRDCRKTVPVGIEVITARQDRGVKTVLKHEYYCRVHGMEYESMTHRQLPDRGPKAKSDNSAYLRNFSKGR